jgi:hypothetical protein
MKQIRDALELLTAQHEELDQLLEHVARSVDADALLELADKLSTHLAVEQALLYPLVAELISLAELDEVVRTHAVIERVLSDLVSRGVADADFAATVDQLGALFAGHRVWQEDDLFTTTAERIGANELAALCERVYAFDRVAAAA